MVLGLARASTSDDATPQRVEAGTLKVTRGGATVISPGTAGLPIVAMPTVRRKANLGFPRAWLLSSIDPIYVS